MGGIEDSVEHHSQGPYGEHIFTDDYYPLTFIPTTDYIWEPGRNVKIKARLVTGRDEDVIDGRFELVQVYGDIGEPNIKPGDYVYYDRKYRESHKLFWTMEDYRNTFLNNNNLINKKDTGNER